MKRIKELAGQALDESVSETWSSLDADQLKRYTDRLAELIIQECVDTMYKRGETYAYPSAGFYQAKTFSDAIIEHFGINNE
jgi:hypothetical protein